jgi:hypothetical protein
MIAWVVVVVSRWRVSRSGRGVGGALVGESEWVSDCQTDTGRVDGDKGT